MHIQRMLILLYDDNDYVYLITQDGYVIMSLQRILTTTTQKWS